MPFGSLLAGPAGEVLAEDRNTVVTEQDITAHPELKLARWAARQLDRDVARQVTMYRSCQPCPMCRGAIARSGLGRVVFALSGEQLQELKPPGSRQPGRRGGRLRGPSAIRRGSRSDRRVPRARRMTSPLSPFDSAQAPTCPVAPAQAFKPSR